MSDGARWNREAEQCVLGAMLLNGEACARALELVERDDFYHEKHRRIFGAAERLHARGTAVEAVALSEELKSAGELDAVGGMGALARLVDAVDAPARLDGHAEVLRELRALRELEKTARAGIEAAQSTGPGAAAGVVASFAERAREVAARSAMLDDDGLQTAREILDDPDARRSPAVVADKLAWAGRTSLIAGREKDGKSTLLRWAVARRSQGLRVWGGAPLGGPLTVLYWGQEVPVDVAADLKRFGADLGRVYVRDMRRHAGDRFALLARDLEAVQPQMVVVDTLSTFVDNMDLDPGNSAHWEPVMNRLGALAQESDAGFALNHHARKADGSYRDSTSIGAGVDVILEMRRAPSEGDRVRKVSARARSAIRASDFSYTLTGTEDSPRLELLDGSLSLEERVHRFVADHEGCSQRDVLDGVRGRTEDIREALRRLSEDGGPVECDDSSTPYRYRIAETPHGNGTETGRKRLGNEGTDGRGRSVSRGGLSPVRESPSETQAGSVEDGGR